MNDRIPGTTYDNSIIYKEKWRIYLNPCNIHHSVDFCYVHDDYDGACDAGDRRCGACESVEACKQEIDERFYNE